jgi:Family of unknown function (DUF5947)
VSDVRAPSRLARLAQRQREPQLAPAADEVCELCSEPIPPEHRHLLDLERQKLLCACRPCSILFDSDAAGGGHYRLVPDRAREIADFDLDDALWEGLRLPVDIAFFFRSTPAGRVVAFYPSPLGPTESLLQLTAWSELEQRNPILTTMLPDVEALLVHRARGAREHLIAPVDRCYALVGVIRTRWKGFGGGSEVWQEIDRFFADLRRGGKTVSRNGP